MNIFDWNSICTAYRMEDNLFLIYHNGRLLKSLRSYSNNEKMPGKMFERFNIGPIFNGYITELNIFDSFLGHEKMDNYT